MVLYLNKYDNLYFNQIKNFVAKCVVEIPCPPYGDCDSTCGVNEFCTLLQNVYDDVCKEESKRNDAKA